MTKIIDQVHGLMTREEELHPDLAAYLCEVGGIGTCLRHPLVYSVPYIPTNALFNAQYAHKKQMIEEYRAEGKWGQLIFMYERPYRMQTFLDIADEIEEHEEYWELFGKILTDTENMHQWQKCLYEAIETDDPERNQARFNIMLKSELWDFAQLSDRVVIYRGCTDENEDGWSWTIRREIARGFATRFGQDGYIIRATVKKSNIIAYFNRRDEYEVFIDPDYVDWEHYDDSEPDEMPLLE